MNDYIMKKNIQTLFDRVEALVTELEELKGGLVTNSRALVTVDNKVTAIHSMVQVALVATKGTGSTEADDGG